jgi:hypothetical protein
VGYVRRVAQERKGGVAVASAEDEAAKARVQEALWQWTQRLIVLAVVFIFGFFAAWVMYGYGPDGAPALREDKTTLEAKVQDLNKKRLDAEGRVEVLQGQLNICRSAAKPSQPTP